MYLLGLCTGFAQIQVESPVSLQSGWYPNFLVKLIESPQNCLIRPKEAHEMMAGGLPQDSYSVIIIIIAALQ